VREADQVIALRLANNRLIPTCMETRSILAEPNADGTLTIYLQSQVPHMHRRWIADTVGIPEHQLRIVAPDIGGGFGAKMHLYPEELLCRIWRVSSACPSVVGIAVPKAINPPIMEGRIRRRLKSPYATTARYSA